MGNIFSGIFGNQAGGRAQQLANYKDQLKQDEELREYQQRNQNLIDQSGAFDTAIQNMSPERQNQMRLFQMMAGGEQTGDKGMEMMSTGFNQRGGLMQTVDANRATNKAGLERDKAFHDWKVANPIPAGESAKESFARFYAALPRTRAEAGEGNPSQESTLDSIREEKFLNLGDRMKSTRTGSETEINLLQKGIHETRAPVLANNLQTFYDEVDETDQAMRQIEMQKERIQSLYDMTSDRTTAFGALMSVLPGDVSKEWQAQKDTILANVGLDKILDLKASSAQGATGLGALNEAELAMLQSYLGKLEQTRNPAGLKKVLDDMFGYMNTLQKKRKSKLKRRRKEFNNNKDAIGLELGTPDDIPEWQEQLFDLDNPYQMNPVGVQLDKGDETPEEIAARIEARYLTPVQE